MTEKILSAGECSRCQHCCIFESYELRLTPAVDDILAGRAKQLRPDVRFANVDGRRLFMMLPIGNDMFACPMLDREKGCMLGEDKPPECDMFPFVLTECGGRRAVAVSSACPIMSERSLRQLEETARELSSQLFLLADKRPELVRRYEKGYTVLVTE